MAGHRFTQIMTGLSDMKSHDCMWGKRQEESRRETEREMLINHSYCQTNLYLHLWPTRPLIPNNKQKRVNIQLIKTSSGVIPCLPVPVASASGWTSLLYNPNQALIYKLQTKTCGLGWNGLALWAGTPKERQRVY